MKYVVTGGAGFIGSHIVKFLVEQKHTVIVIDNLQVGTKKRLESIKEKIDFHHADILNFDEVEQIVQGTDGIFHQAALTSLPESFEKPEEYYDVNVNGTENIFKLSKKYGFKVVYASSSSVYGEVKKIPISENFEKNPLNPYAETKLQALCSKSMEQVAAGHASTKNIMEIKRKIDKEYYKSRKLRSFLKNQWLTEIRKAKDFTPNNFFVKKDEYVKKCVQFMRPRR